MNAKPYFENISDESSMILMDQCGLDVCKKVRVYWNLHKKCFSVMQGGKVVAHTAELTLHTANYVVRQSGRLRVIMEGKKNVHAFVEGYIESSYWDLPMGPFARISYNPYVGKTFFRHSDDSVRYSSDTVKCETWRNGIDSLNRPCVLEIVR